MKREIATMGLIIPFIEKYTPESKFDTIELEVYDEFGKIKRIFMDQISIKTISEYPSGEKIVLSIDMRSNKYLQECLNKENFEDDEEEEMDEEVVNDFVDTEDSEEICDSNKTDKKDIKMVDINYAVNEIKKAAKTLSSAYPHWEDLCTDEWPGNKYIITPDQC